MRSGLLMKLPVATPVRPYEAGWKRGPDGIRAKDGKRLKLVFQTSINAPRQKSQAIVKQACQKAGIDMELKSVTPSVYFSSDAANPDTAWKFYADIQMLTTGVGAPPDPEGLMRQFLSSEIAAKENKWQRGNATRWRNEAYDNLFHAAEGELDPVKRAALLIEAGRAKELPVIYTTGERRPDNWDAGSWRWKSTRGDTCRFQWREGSLAFWDNRSTWHFAVNDYHGERRLLLRITIAGEKLS
jgi:peptide/nickel transport system substrate-binding protein